MRKSKGFTLVELMVVITIIALLSSLMLVAMFGAQEGAKAQKTRSLIAKLDAVVVPLYEDYRARAVSVQLDSVVASRGWNNAAPVFQLTPYSRKIAKARLDALRELQRMELPDRWSDIGGYDASDNPIITGTVSGVSRPAILNSYFRRYAAAVAKAKTLNPSGFKDIVNNFEQAECLYMVVSMLGEDGLENFSQADIGDLDEDGAKEFHDGWGRPISWLRWPAGFDSPITRVAGSAVTTTTSATVWSGDDNLSDQDDAYTGHVIRFTTGNLIGQMVRVEDYKGSTREFTVSGTSIAAAHASRFNIIGPDRFDSRKVYPPMGNDFWGKTASGPSNYQAQLTFEIHPLIYSSGSDGEPAIAKGDTGGFTYMGVNNNPYYPAAGGVLIGTPTAGSSEWQDNITNHDLGRR